MGVKEDVSDKIDTLGVDWRNPVILLHFQFEMHTEVFGYIRAKGVQRRLIGGQDDYVIGIPKIILYTLNLFEPVVQAG